MICTDIFGGSPSNLSLRACSPSNRRILYGMNLPMLIKLAKSRHAAPVSAAAIIPALQQTLRWLRQDLPSPETTQPDEWLRRAALSWDPARFAGITEMAIEN